MAESYDPKKVNVIVNGLYLTGYMDGTFVSAEKNEDNTIPHIGAHGEVTYAKSADNTGTITVTLKQTSPSLAALMQLANSDVDFPVQVIDANSSKRRVGGNECRMLKTPTIEFGAEVSGVEVQFYVADYSVA